MKTRFAVFSMVILTAAMLRAQSPNQQPGSIFGFSALAPRGAPQLVSRSLPAVQQPANPKCPVSMRAQHLSDGNLMKAARLPHFSGIGQKLHLTLLTPDARTVSSANVTIHGSSPKGRLMHSGSVLADSPDVSRTLTVQFAAAENHTAIADTWIPGLTAVQQIDLNSVTYADGSTLKLNGDLACRITPDGFMLISGR